MSKPTVQYTLETARGFDGLEPTEGFVNPMQLSDDEKREFLAAIDDRSILRVAFRAVVYRDIPNANHWRVSDLAQCVAGTALAEDTPTLRVNHGPGVYARVGSVRSVVLEEGSLIAEMELTEPSEMRAFIRGERDRFSIGLAQVKHPTCSICGEDYTDHTICPHIAGRTYNDDVCEVFVEGVVGEVSFVGSPAVPGTHILHTEENSMAKKQDDVDAQGNREKVDAEIAEVRANAENALDMAF